jgi:Holliday junction resolvase RusA-like endonuclease
MTTQGLNIDPSTYAGPLVSTAVMIIIGGPPTAKGRPRMTRKGFIYTPAATRKYEAHGRLAAQQAMDGRPPITGPVRADIGDDSLVVELVAVKRYALTPKLTIVIVPLPALTAQGRT